MKLESTNIWATTVGFSSRLEPLELEAAVTMVARLGAYKPNGMHCGKVMMYVYRYL